MRIKTGFFFLGVIVLTLTLVVGQRLRRGNGPPTDRYALESMERWLTHPCLNDARWNTDDEFEPLDFQGWLLRAKAIKDAEKLLQRILISNPSGLMRSRSAMALGFLGSHDSVAVLMSALRDRDLSVQSNAAGALGQLRALEAIDVLCTASRHSDPTVRGNACIALGEIGGHRAVNRLREVRSEEKHSSVRDCVEDALKRATSATGK
jgi:hypothetical protein